jgi:hypothetical protein
MFVDKNKEKAQSPDRALHLRKVKYYLSLNLMGRL